MCGTTCCESIALLGCGDITCLPLRAFVALSFFSSFNFPLAQLVVSCSNGGSLRLRLPVVVPATAHIVGRSPTSAGERSGNKPIPGFVPCCNVRCSPIRLKCG